MAEGQAKAIRDPAPIWLRALAYISVVLMFTSCLLFLKADVDGSDAFVWCGVAVWIAVAIAGWFIVRNLATRAAVGVLALAAVVVGLLAFGAVFLPESSPPPPTAMPAPPAPISAPTAMQTPPAGMPAPPVPVSAPMAAPSPAPSEIKTAIDDLSVRPTSVVVTGIPDNPSPPLPLFPWPPPGASASYVLPDDLFAGRRALGDVVAAIIVALEKNGYVERSFFATAAGGLAMVTRLERINDDGSPADSRERWPASDAEKGDLLSFLRGLFFVDPGHYRVIVFVIQDLPFTQSSEQLTGPQARAWLRSGANVLPPELGERPFAGGHCTVLVYEFASDGTTVHVVESALTGKQHLEKAGVLALLEKPN
jgi:hypothetical protein